MSEARLQILPAPFAAVAALERELGCSQAVAQVLVRRGFADPQAARAWLAGDERHPPEAFGGMDEAVAAILAHVGTGSRIVVHGDYDVDGVSSTAILVRVLRDLGADVGWYLPSRTEDGYGLSPATVERLAAEGCRLLVTADCGITAVDEVAAARALGMDVVVTDHHTPRSDGALPDAPIVHPRVGGYPCGELCAAGVAYFVSRALLAASGRDPAEADIDLDLVALATVADCVPLVGENRRLVRDGLKALAGTRRVGLRALMGVAKCDPGAVDARSCGFRLAPRINAAGRLHRADAGLELMLTDDPDRAKQIAEELDSANAERRHVEQRILFEAEGQVAQYPDAAAFVLAGEGWHPGVIGIVASRIAERHGRPCVVVALDGDEGTGSGRSIPAFDLLGGLNASAEHLIRHGGHRAAAGCTIRREDVDAFRAAFVAHAASVLAPEDFLRTERVDAVVSGDELGSALAEELEALAPFGQENPEVSLLVPAARLTDARQMGEGKHIRFTVEAGGARARAVAFGMSRLPEGAEDGCFDATFGLELNEWNGTVEPRLVLRNVLPCAPEPIALVGEPEDPVASALLEAATDPTHSTFDVPETHTCTVDRRGVGIAGTIAALVATGEPVLVVCADARARRKAIEGRLGGFAIVSYAALARDPALAARHAHLVALDPPTERRHEALLGGRMTHLAWGEPELAFAGHVHERDLDLRHSIRALYADLRARGDAALADAHPLVAGRCLRILGELGLVDGTRLVENPPRTELERSPSFVAYLHRLEDTTQWLSSARRQAA
ncbi:MAG: single-stranded-DNA-specific exonuclease RecJ [Solirubrobacterales bacterium]|nr:single-stranded-DNA-specific exonuclease RecJ [Solirubrobacterales bacterium]